ELADQDRRREGRRQAQDRDRGVEPVALQVAQRRDEVVAEHRTAPSSVGPNRAKPRRDQPVSTEYGREGRLPEIQHKQGVRPAESAAAQPSVRKWTLPPLPAGRS